MVGRVRMAASRWVRVMNLKKLAHKVLMALDSMVVVSEEGHGFLELQDGSKACEKACSMNQFTVIPVPFLIAARWRLTKQKLKMRRHLKQGARVTAETSRYGRLT